MQENDQQQSGWVIEAGPSTLKDPPPEPLESFQSMNEEVVLGERNDELSDPILPCQKPWLELTLLDDNGEPAAYANYRITAPGGGGRTGQLDANGHVHIDDIDVPADKAMLKVWIVDNENDPDAPPTYEIQLVPKAPDPEVQQIETEQPPEEPEYFHPTFDRRVADEDEASDPVN